jgi:hypothetical protein
MKIVTTNLELWEQKQLKNWPFALKLVKTEGLEAVKPFCTLYTSVMLLSRSQIHSKWQD